MSALIESVIRWTGRNFIAFLVIVAILAAANFAQDELKEFTSVTSERAALTSGEKAVDQHWRTLETDTVNRVAQFEKASTDALKNRIAELDRVLHEKRAAQRLPFERARSIITADSRFVVDLKGDAEIKLLEQEREYLGYVLAAAVSRAQKSVAYAELERLRTIHAAVYSRLMKNQQDQTTLDEGSYLRARVLPWSTEYEQRKELKRSFDELYNANQSAHRQYQIQRNIVAVLDAQDKLLRFEIRREQIDDLLQPVRERYAELDKRYGHNWLAKLSEPVIHVVPTALGILLSIMLVPIGIKAFFYFGIAPWAARRPDICLLPGVSGIIEGDAVPGGDDMSRTKMSSVSLSITVDEAHELLIHPEYLQSSSLRGAKDTKWLLDWSYPLSSLSSGMVALTRIRATALESVTVSSTRDPFSELGIISVPEGSAVVLQPHCLVGVVQRKELPMKISRHWRLGSLNAWLTLQLRYLAFHGPARLIVKGCRGVRIEKAGTGRSINQAATIGFSANLSYSTTRCETFASYLMGKQELFNDKFSGGPGFYVYEETPHFGKKTGITGRGIEGVTDSLLKVFGI
ncbi:MAG: hypothetical protein ABI790_06570 [Betaproteobacteria bacterium]